MNKLIAYVNKLNPFKFILLAPLLSYISTIPFTLISIYFHTDNGFNPNNGLPLILNIFLAIFLVPIVESGIICILTAIISKIFTNKFYITLVTAIIFSSLHYYSFIYVIAVFIPSIILTYSYLIYKSRNKYLTPIIIMTIIHMLYNFYNILFSNFF